MYFVVNPFGWVSQIMLLKTKFPIGATLTLFSFPHSITNTSPHSKGCFVVRYFSLCWMWGGKEADMQNWSDFLYLGSNTGQGLVFSRECLPHIWYLRHIGPFLYQNRRYCHFLHLLGHSWWAYWALAKKCSEANSYLTETLTIHSPRLISE